MNITDRFSITDFLAYFFPGVIGLSGVLVLLFLTPIKDTLFLFPLDIVGAIIFGATSYIFGLIFSGTSRIFISKNNSRAKIPFGAPLKGEIEYAFCDIFLRKKSGIKWNEDCFYLCRSLVLELMPGGAIKARRQNDLNQMRSNIITPLIIWFIGGISWGINYMLQSYLTSGLSLIIVVVIIFILSINSILARLKRNQDREVFEVLSAFLAGYKAGVFRKTKV